mmetsp:Transcript_45681/g.33399  ORF Transcript_45681/g.33399 Transcript_45681/m.33399 type:complete len:174 (+) Transcript_45681:582-1103(+)
MQRSTFMHFINRVLYPTVHLKSELEIQTFVNLTAEFEEITDFYSQKYEKLGYYYKRMGKKVRVIGFFGDKREFKHEFKQFQDAAQKLAVRDDLRIAYVTDRDLVNDYKQKYNHKWFEQYSHNSIVLFKESGEYFYYNVEDSTADIGDWINKMSLSKYGNDFNLETRRIIHLLN